MAIKYTKFSIPSLYKIYPNWDFWYGNIQSGNPGGETLWLCRRVMREKNAKPKKFEVDLLSRG
jgi:hypothetical protein